MHMQRAIALIGLIAAMVFVGYSAVTLYNTAYSITNLPWQKPLAGWAAALLVMWEALALVFAGLLWNHAQRPLAVSCVLLLVAGVCFTFRLELINQIQGSADTIAERVQTVNRAVTDKTELEELRKQRTVWLTKTETASQREQRAVREELEKLNVRIDAIIKRQGEGKAILEVTPEAALAARLLGGDEAHWRDVLALMLILFWPMARIVATPVAFAFYAIAFVERARTHPVMNLAPMPRMSAISAEEPEIMAPIQADPVQQIAPPSEAETPQEQEPPAEPVKPVAQFPARTDLARTPVNPKKAKRMKRAEGGTGGNILPFDSAGEQAILSAIRRLAPVLSERRADGDRLYFPAIEQALLEEGHSIGKKALGGILRKEFPGTQTRDWTRSGDPTYYQIKERGNHSAIKLA